MRHARETRGHAGRAAHTGHTGRAEHVAILGNIIVYLIMACMVAGGVASMVTPESELGKQFVEGICSIGPIFFSVAGIFASIPFLVQFIEGAFGPLFALVGADPAMAATTVIAVDMGGYQAADALAQTRESWIMAMYTGFMAGATIVYTVPIGLRMIGKNDQKYFALGIMCGFLAIPIGVLAASVITALANPVVRDVISTNAEATYQLALSFGLIFQNLVPLVVACVLIALGLHFIPNGMIRGFTVFGRFIDYAARTVLVCCILEHFTGVFTLAFGGWGFDPIMADAESLERAVEVVCSIAMMLAGAFPMVYLVKTYLAKPLGRLGRLFGLSEMATAGMLAAAANALALFPMVRDMRAEDKVKTVAFSVCGAFLIGDHLSFAANFQPTLIVPLFVGKLLAAGAAVAFVRFLALQKARALEQEDLRAQAAADGTGKDAAGAGGGAPLPDGADAEGQPA